MNVDSLNNSQLILLVLLIALVVSAATAVATLSIVYERIAITQTDVVQPTIIQQTVNRIIERETIPIAVEESEEEEMLEEETSPPVTITTIKGAFVRLFHGSQQVSAAVFVSADGALLTPGVLEKEKRYNVAQGTELVPFSVVVATSQYSLLRPMAPYTPEAYVPLETTVVEVGQPVILFGGFGEDMVVFSEIVSQKQVNADTTERIRTSAVATDLALPSAVVVNNTLVGFLSDYTGWIPLNTLTLTKESADEKEEEGETAGRGV